MIRNSFFFSIISGLLPVLYFISFSFKAMVACLAAASLLAGLGIVLNNLDRIYLKRSGLFIIAVALGLATGMYLVLQNHNSRNAYFRTFTDVTSFCGTVYRDSIPSGTDGFIHYITIETIHSRTGNYSSSAAGKTIVIDNKGTKYYTGQRLEISSRLRKTDDAENHFISYAGRGRIKEAGFSSTGYWWRYNILLGLDRLIARMGQPAGSLFKALFLGAREDLSGELTTVFRETGTLHLLALSGLHVGIVYLLITLLLWPLPGRWLKIIIGVLFVLFYLFLVGPRPSLLRATLMLVILGIIKLLDREVEPLNIIAMAALIILILDPAAAFSLSFQLSFLALLGIILVGGKISRFFAPRIPGILLLPLACSTGAQLATAPVILYHFGILYPAGIVVTLLLVPVVTVFIGTGILFLVLGLINPAVINAVGAWIMNFLYLIIYKTAGFFSVIPGLGLGWQPWYLILFLAVLPFFLVKRRSLAR